VRGVGVWKKGNGSVAVWPVSRRSRRIGRGESRDFLAVGIEGAGNGEGLIMDIDIAIQYDWFKNPGNSNPNSLENFNTW
jgi:hypothetical protein